MPGIYCGNNALDPSLANGQNIVGTRYGCMKKGIGRGMHMPVDPNYGNYQPINNQKVYCGNGNNVPGGYVSHGTLPQCLTKGVGVGKRIRFDQFMINGFSPPAIPVDHISGQILLVVFLCSVILSVIVLRRVKPEFILDEDDIVDVKLYVVSITIGLILTVLLRIVI
uniref:Uncharacterized protein n=1 Tax=viral metagenome TaxID=1070528 RepID=A0A6C0LVC1_9ZZZZ